MNETIESALNTLENGASEQSTSTATEAPKQEQGARPGRESKKGRKGAAKKGADKSTSKTRKRAFSNVACKSKRHVIVTTDKKGAETYACGRIETSRTAKINAVLLSAGRPLTTAQVQEKLDALYGAGAIKCVSNHLRTMLTKGALTLKEGAYAMKSKAPKQTSEAPVESDSEAK